MKKLENLGRSLAKTEQKRIIGGYIDPGGGGGGCQCVSCQCLDNGYHSCWCTNSPSTLCDRVYPNCNVLAISGGCVGGDGCTYN